MTDGSVSSPGKVLEVASVKCHFDTICPFMLVHAKEKQAVIYEVFLVSVCSGKYDGQSFFLCFRHVIILV